MVCRVKCDFACTLTGAISPCTGCPAGTVALGAGGADTYTQRAIPGSDLFRVRSPPRLGSRASSQATMPAALSGSDRDYLQPTIQSGTPGVWLALLPCSRSPLPEPDCCRTWTAGGPVQGRCSRSRSDAEGALDRSRLARILLWAGSGEATNASTYMFQFAGNLEHENATTLGRPPCRARSWHIATN